MNPDKAAAAATISVHAELLALRLDCIRRSHDALLISAKLAILVLMDYRPGEDLDDAIDVLRAAIANAEELIMSPDKAAELRRITAACSLDAIEPINRIRKSHAELLSAAKGLIAVGMYPPYLDQEFDALKSAVAHAEELAS